MRRILAVLTVIAAASLLAGCVYDPYTGTYVPCCNYYGYPYYRYPYYRYPPGYYAPYGSYMVQPSPQPGAYYPPPQQPSPAGSPPNP